MRHLHRVTILTLVLALMVTACGGDTGEGEDTTTTAVDETTTTEVPQELTLMAHESFAEAVDDSTFGPFTEETGIAVDVLASDDAGTLVNQAALSADNPLADVLFGVDDTFLSRAINEGIFRPHESENLGTVADDLHHPDNLVTPIDYGDVCFNYDKEWFESNDVEVPDDLEDLTTEEYAPYVTVEHPATSSPGLAFMLATIDTFGEDGWLDWWQQMKDAGVNIANDWNTAYYSDFTRYGGDSSMVMSYASSPPAEVIFSEEPLDEAPTGVIEAGCYRQVEYAGVLDGTDYPGAAGDLIDYMLSVEFQEMIPLNWFVFPTNQEAELPQEFVEHTTIPESPTRLGSDEIAENRDRWIDEWIAVMEG